MLVSDIVRGIQVCVEAVATFRVTAFEEGLRAAIRAMLIATFTTRLTGVSGVYLFGFPSKGTFKSLSGFDTSLNEHIRIQLRVGLTHRIVRSMVQFDAILLVVLPTIGTHLIEDLRKLLQRGLQRLILFLTHMQLYSYRSVHAISIAYMQRYCQIIAINSGPPVPKSQERSGMFHPRAKDEGSPHAE
jgi:hypothetical protein